MPQQLLFELDGARVTPHIATFGGTSYQIANIGSVHVVRRKKYKPLAVVIFVLGLGILAAAIVKSDMTELVEEYSSMAATGVAVMVASVLLQLIWPRRVSVLVLRTSSGEVDAVMSRNKEFVFNVQKAVEQAFVVRARPPPGKPDPYQNRWRATSDPRWHCGKSLYSEWPREIGLASRAFALWTRWVSSSAISFPKSAGDPGNHCRAQ